jgi:hypothetical protein
VTLLWGNPTPWPTVTREQDKLTCELLLHVPDGPTIHVPEELMRLEPGQVARLVLLLDTTLEAEYTPSLRRADEHALADACEDVANRLSRLLGAILLGESWPPRLREHATWAMRRAVDARDAAECAVRLLRCAD